MRPRLHAQPRRQAGGGDGDQHLARLRRPQHRAPAGAGARRALGAPGSRRPERQGRPAIRAWFRKLFPGKLPPTLEEADRAPLAAFQERLGYRFKDPALLLLALTHRSWAFQEGMEREASNERLEFLGDAVLGLAINVALVAEFPEENEGTLTKLKSLLASRVVLASVAGDLGLGAVLRLSANEEETGGRTRDSILADAFEAVLGAVYLDGGLLPARKLVASRVLARKEEFLADDSHRNFKSLLQERVQSVYKLPPRYRVEATWGPDHSKDFEVEVLVQGQVVGRGSGRSKKDAEQDAARAALARLGEGEAGFPELPPAATESGEFS
ncbi:ribonuclease III [bacterium]|nr:ribonuclease III [bacterium]